MFSSLLLACLTSLALMLLCCRMPVIYILHVYNMQNVYNKCIYNNRRDFEVRSSI